VQTLYPRMLFHVPSVKEKDVFPRLIGVVLGRAVTYRHSWGDRPRRCCVIAFFCSSPPPPRKEGTFSSFVKEPHRLSFIWVNLPAPALAVFELSLQRFSSSLLLGRHVCRCFALLSFCLCASVPFLKFPFEMIRIFSPRKIL